MTDLDPGRRTTALARSPDTGRPPLRIEWPRQPGLPGSPGPPVRLRDRWCFPAVFLIALLVFAGTDTGRTIFDTKLGVDIDAAGFLSRLWPLWNPLEWFGTLQNQYIGYAIPMAPFFLLGQFAHDRWQRELVDRADAVRDRATGHRDHAALLEGVDPVTRNVLDFE